MTDNLLKEMREYAAKEYVPIIRPETERILCSMIEKIRPKRMLELGAAIGYSSISFSRYIADDGVIITVERDEDRAEMARRNIATLGLEGKIRLIEDDALTLLRSMDREVDIIFLDADKSHYIDYYEDCLRLLKKGGIIIADNVLFAGLVEKDGEAERKHRTIVNNLRLFLKTVEEDDRVESELLKVEDGVMIIRKL
ncbi:MAG: O-methyltransferase [Clostridia bacterium]|nr:O-methyltransferase [Clostridia bacterium]